MTAMHRIAVTASAIVLALALCTGAKAAPAGHPAYLHALSDLRDARAHLERPDGGAVHQQEKDAVAEIDRAIGEIKAASIDDGKNLNDHPPVDAHLAWVGRLNKAARLLDRARDDVSHAEDDPAAQGLQARALDHIAKARRRVEEAISLEQ
jgi:hypothetical protein